MWNGEQYDAIQTNIVINHLALVASARAGEQARLNIDGSDEHELKGGKAMTRVTNYHHNDDGAMSPEELEKAIAAYKARKAERSADKEEPKDAETDDEETTETHAPAAEEKEAVDSDGEENPTEEKGSTPEDIAKMVKDRRDRRDSENDPEDTESAMGVIAQQDEDIDMLLACLEKFFAEEKAEGNHAADDEDCNKDGDEEDEEKNEDSSDDKSKSLNADSADEIFRQRLSICRIGDKLHMDGLEAMSIKAGKKAIIAKVLPNMRMDGKSDAYIDAMYDLAVGEVNKRKNVAYQKEQMKAQAPKTRMDSNESLANSARQRMIEREGGNQ